MNYSEQIKHPKWQKVRLKILERDNFTCQECLSKDSSLNVHHKIYLKDHLIWEYDETLLITLCQECHDERHSLENGIKSQITRFNNTDLLNISLIINNYTVINPIIRDTLLNISNLLNCMNGKIDYFGLNHSKNG